MCGQRACFACDQRAVVASEAQSLADMIAAHVFLSAGNPIVQQLRDFAEQMNVASATREDRAMTDVVEPSPVATSFASANARLAARAARAKLKRLIADAQHAARWWGQIDDVARMRKERVELSDELAVVKGERALSIDRGKVLAGRCRDLSEELTLQTTKRNHFEYENKALKKRLEWCEAHLEKRGKLA